MTDHRDRPPLRVGVNLTWLVPGVVGGSEEYLVRSLLALPVAAPVEVTIFGLDTLRDAHPELARRFAFATLALRGRPKAARIAAETSWLAVEARRRRLDVVHHGGGVLPLWAPAATVVTIHDLQPLDLPEAFSPLKRRWLGLMLPRAAHRADLVVTTSEFVRRGVIDRFAVPSRRVRLVPPCLVGTPATTTPTRPGPARPAPGCLEPLRRRWDIGERYVVYPAITYPHKNHAVLAEAVAAPAWPADLHLVLPGGEASGELRLATRLAALPPDRRRLVHRLGRIPRDELDALIAEARAVAFPSRYEGFGIPVLEALDAGTPVVAAQAGALPEVVGTAGRLLDPGDPGAWATTLADVASAPPRHRRRMAAAARTRAADFSPARTGAALIDAWRRAARPAERRASPTTAVSSAP